MNITPDVVKYEFIGLQIRVVKSTNPCVIGTEGKILDETRNTFTILHNNKEKVVVKDTSVFELLMPDGQIVSINGNAIKARPEDRLKKYPRRLW